MIENGLKLGGHKLKYENKVFEMDSLNLEIYSFKSENELLKIDLKLIKSSMIREVCLKDNKLEEKEIEITK